MTFRDDWREFTATFGGIAKLIFVSVPAVLVPISNAVVSAVGGREFIPLGDYGSFAGAFAPIVSSVMLIALFTERGSLRNLVLDNRWTTGHLAHFVFFGLPLTFFFWGLSGLLLVLVGHFVPSVFHALTYMLAFGFITLSVGLFSMKEYLVESTQAIYKDLKSAGLVRVFRSFQNSIDWKSYFETAKELDVFFAYGRTWRHTHSENLRKLASRDGSSIRVVLPDPDDQITMTDMAKHFSYTIDELRGYIAEAVEDFKGLSVSAGVYKAKVEIWFYPGSHQFSFYRFDNVVIMATYSHTRERTPVPTLVCTEGGALYAFLANEFQMLTKEGGLARRIT